MHMLIHIGEGVLRCKYMNKTYILKCVHKVEVDDEMTDGCVLVQVEQVNDNDSNSDNKNDKDSDVELDISNLLPFDFEALELPQSLLSSSSSSLSLHKDVHCIQLPTHIDALRARLDKFYVDVHTNDSNNEIKDCIINPMVEIYRFSYIHTCMHAYIRSYIYTNTCAHK